MVVDETGRLQMGIDGRRTEKLESPTLQVFTETLGQFGHGGNLLDRTPFIADHLMIDERPNIRIERTELGLDFEKTFGVIDGRLDFTPVFDDARVSHQAFDILCREGGDTPDVEIGLGRAVLLTFS